MPRLIALAIAIVLLPAPSVAQSAANVLVVINERSAASVEVGGYYANARGIPAEQIARIDTSIDETVTFEEYERTIEAPVWTWIARHALHDRILYIVLTKGVPIRIRGTGGREGTGSSVDSELALLYRRSVGSPTSIVGRQGNPYYLGERATAEARPFTRFDHDIYLVTRLDGFTVPDVIGLIDRGRTPSREGHVVLDERAQVVDAGGDRWLRLAADRLESHGEGGRVVLEATREVAHFEGPVLGYYSWGSNDRAYRRRSPGLSFAPGAIAGWFVSTDGRTFLEPPADWIPGPSVRPVGMFGSGSQSVAADLVRAGVTGMAAHVGEPFLDGTVRPQVLFPAYLSGFNLAEAYYLAMPYLSWQNIVIGDPLVAPFRKEALAPEAIDRGLDPDTGLPALFAERRLAVLAQNGANTEALKLWMKSGVLTVRGDEAGAEELMRKAVDLEPRLVAASHQLAARYEARAEYDRAIAEYRRIIAVSPKNVIALNNLAYALAVRKGDLDEALRLARTAHALDSQPNVADTLGWILYLSGEHDLARPILERAAAAAPKAAEIQLHAAFLHAALGETTRARAELDAALKLDPKLADREDVATFRAKIGW